MSAPASAAVVVGVDGSPLSLVAVRLAAREAALSGRPLRVVHSFWVADQAAPGGELGEPAEQVADRAVATGAAAELHIEISAALIEGPAATALLRESGSAALVVLGDGGLASRSMPVDATSVQVAARAGCSVLVVREVPRPAGPVLVGVDGSASSQGALDFAFDSAARREAELIVVRAFDAGDAPGEPATGAAEQLAEVVAPWQQKYPSVAVTQRARTGDPTAIMIEESGAAELVVVSARGEQPWRGMLGEVSQALLYHAPAPVVIVRHAHELYIQE
jgi:nucleotide-binding universal stress UspA family protein